MRFSLTGRICGLLCAILIGLNAFAAEEVLFERKMTDEESAHFTVVTREEQTRYRALKDVKDILWGTISSQFIVETTAVFDPKGQEPVVLRMVVRMVKPSATIYERQLPREDVDRYSFKDVDDAIGDDLTLEEIRAQFSRKYWDQEWGVERVEVLFYGAYRGQYDKEPHLRTRRLNPINPKLTEKEKDEEQQWLTMAKKRLSVGKDTPSFKHVDTKCEYSEIRRLMDARVLPRGEVQEEFADGAGRTIYSHIRQFASDDVPLHEFLRTGIYWLGNAAVRMRQTDIGPVLVISGGIGDNGTTIEWASGNLKITVGSNQAVGVQELLQLYGDKFPSTFQKNVELDKTKWYREEAQLILARLKELEPFTTPMPFDKFRMNMADLFKTIYLPDLEKDFRLKRRIDNKQELYNTIRDWWEKNGDKTVWDKKAQKLIVKQE